MGSKKFFATAAVVLAMLPLAACGRPDTPLPEILGGYPVGVKVDNVKDVCKAVTKEEVGAVLGIEGLFVFQDEEVGDVLRDDNGKALTPDPGIGKWCTFKTGAKTPDTTDIMVQFIYLYDPDKLLYNYYRELSNNLPSVSDLGDEAFVEDGRQRAGLLGYTARWGVWDVKLRQACVAFKPGVCASEPNPELLMGLMRTFMSRLPRDYQQ